VQQPIPIWFGGRDERVLRRLARHGDGWMLPAYRQPADSKPALEMLRDLLVKNGRAPAGFGVEPRLNYGEGDAHTWQRLMLEWVELGATHLSFNTMGVGLDTPQKHIAAIRTFAEILKA
jgi:alkanesulfonate monooxygenase SsuD/methylene tetrahydromethanopterin reductase-like flavin-dependent oxidoreductase (luciferase family)